MFSSAELDDMRLLSEGAMLEQAEIQASTPSLSAGGETVDAWATIDTFICRLSPLTADEVEKAQRDTLNLSWALILPYDAVIATDEERRAIVTGSTGAASWTHYLILRATSDPHQVSAHQRWLCEEVQPW